MPRSVNAVASRARRKRVLKLAKGYYGRRKNVWTVAKNAVEKGLVYAYRDRRQKKRNFRALWIQRINAVSVQVCSPDQSKQSSVVQCRKKSQVCPENVEFFCAL